MVQPGSTLAWGARGREFESRYADFAVRITALSGKLDGALLFTALAHR
jgi:hypothetical protein